MDDILKNFMSHVDNFIWDYNLNNLYILIWNAMLIFFCIDKINKQTN